MKITRKITALLILLTLLVSTATTAFAAGASPSDWAKDEVAEAIALGFVPERLQSDYQKPITRAEFAEVALLFVTMQYRLPLELFIRDYVPRNGDFESRTEFTDIDDVENSYFTVYACDLGIVEGRGDGIFDPHSPITRQEAATMLVRAYDVYFEAPDGFNVNMFTPDFTDYNEVADWAIYGVMLMANYQVMNGMGDGSFAPEETYTREQCYATFLRLYKNAPVSRYLKNVEPLFTPEEYVAGIYEQVLWGTVEYELETDEFYFIWYSLGGLPHGNHNNTLNVVYKGAEGGRNVLNLTNVVIEDFNLDETDYIVTFTLTRHYHTIPPATTAVTIDLRTFEITEI